MRSILFLLAICTVNSFQLVPATIEKAASVTISFDVANNVVSANVIMSSITQKIKGTELQEAGHLFDGIAKEISLSLIADNQIGRLKWERSITVNLGILKVLNIAATIKQTQYPNLSVTITTKIALIRQPIPAVYNSEVRCARTGSRKYLIAGPRDRECNTIYVPRGLNQGEIDIVNNALNARLPDAQRMLS
jgi:hypothetical protein